MPKLLSANFARLWRSAWFWVGAVLIAASAVQDAVTARKILEYSQTSLDGVLVNFAPWQFILLPGLCGLFINTDYHDGTIRNKLTVGCSRGAVYMSNLIALYTASLFYTALSVSTILLVGAGIPVMDPKNVAGRLCLLLLVFLALAAVSVFLSMMISSRSILMVCALLGLGLMFGGQMVNNMLEHPKVVPDYNGVVYVTDENGNQVMQYLDREGNPIAPEDIPMVPNPGYIAEPARTVLRGVNTIHPGGQLWEILYDGHREFNEDGTGIALIQTPRWQLVLYAAAMTLAATGMGLALFRRKDLK